MAVLRSLCYRWRHYRFRDENPKPNLYTGNKMATKPKIKLERYMPSKHGPRWIRRDNWSVEIDGEIFYGFISEEQAKHYSKSI